MTSEIDRREFIKLAGIGGVVFMSSLYGVPGLAMPGSRDFFFVQLSDSHWGFEGPKINPDARGTLKKAIKEVNALNQKPDFVVFTGDLTQTTDDTKVRQARMKEFKEIVGELDTKVVHFMPGEHDASLDNGETYKKFFGETHYAFDHKGVHFIAIDNVSDPTGSIGDGQLAWLRADLAMQKPDTDIVVFTHRPLFDLYPQWDWATRDGSKAIELLMPFKNVSVFYGHIHQENHHATGHILHHSATSLMLPMPVAGSTPKRMPIPWNAEEPYKGLGFRNVLSQTMARKFELRQYPINEAGKI
ncbi:MAG: metallophosphoesterase [Cyanobacteria bacterium REEB67]|nr:metallophosphoesterase [Cyanobacteria bacterium REEB67]